VREAEPNSVTIPDLSLCLNESNKNVTVEKIYIDVEDEKVYDNDENLVKPLLNLSETGVNIEILETIEDNVNNYSSELLTDSNNDINVTMKNESDSLETPVSENVLFKDKDLLNEFTPVSENLLFKDKDLLNEFDSILNSYESLDVLLNESNSMLTSTDSNNDDDWGDMLNELFPSLSSL